MLMSLQHGACEYYLAARITPSSKLFEAEDLHQTFFLRSFVSVRIGFRRADTLSPRFSHSEKQGGRSVLAHQKKLMNYEV